jgi:hypothetical protein
MRNLLALIGLGTLLFLGYKFRDRIPGPWNHAAATMQVSEQAARSADEKLARMRSRGDTVHLTDVEFTSYLRYRFKDQFTDQLDAPTVQFSGDTLTLNGRFPTDRLPDTRDVRALRDFLPDTADVKVRGQLRTLGTGRGAIRIDNVSVAKVPVPRDVYIGAIKRAGVANDPSLAAGEYPFRLPPGVGSARVENGQLVLGPAR